MPPVLLVLEKRAWDGHLDGRAERLKELWEKAGRAVDVHTLATNIGDVDQLRGTLAEVEPLGPLGCVFYNAAGIQPSEVLTTPVEEIEEDFETTTLALYVTAQWAMPLLKNSGEASPSFIVTSSLLPEQPLPFVLSSSAVKASQQNVLQSLRAAFGQEIHIGLVKVGDMMSLEEKNLNPARIAEETIGFYDRPVVRWDDDIVLHQS
ncbi:hypothetical protein DOTSEDRAFT_27664 [Dothistroma septosporum NZE10]|uniref:Ketoreductase (KR) domain-containing protein n=1 Tax=Dothistroma septosporum (strain NZE10 / CBS 128990) TaxID=675120 RepID=N1PEM6_DOTSN|nr:hypothetical protein DOTSEDRAFT_27664 [Dothistroma septosporum NZE10]